MISDDKIWKNFEQARKFVHELNLNSHKEWVKFCKSGTKSLSQNYPPVDNKTAS
jgi:hypothetical protein